MSAIPKDAADIPPASPHPTGAATVININSVASHSTTTTNPASPSRPPSRDLSPEAHQAEYRAHAYLANQSIVATKLAADKLLQSLFTKQNEPDPDILRAASAASRARLQNPFANNTSRSSGSSSTSSGSTSGSSGPSYPRDNYSSSRSFTPGSPHTPAQNSRHPCPSTTAPQSAPSVPTAPVTPAAPAPISSNSTAAATQLSAPRPVSTAPAIKANPVTAPTDADQPLTEADFTDCIKLEDVIANTAGNAAPAVINEPAAAGQPNPVKIVAAPLPEAASELAISQSENLAISPPAPPCLNLAMWPFDHLTISPYKTSWPHGP